MKQEITVFIQNAYAQNYLAPNRIILKNQRSKWRFHVKNYIKELEKISKLLLYAATGGLSREALHIQQETVLFPELRTSDVKYMAVKEAKKLIDERINRLDGLKKYDSKRYGIEEAINNLCDMILLIQVSLVELEAFSCGI